MSASINALRSSVFFGYLVVDKRYDFIPVSCFSGNSNFYLTTHYYFSNQRPIKNKIEKYIINASPREDIKLNGKILNKGYISFTINPDTMAGIINQNTIRGILLNQSITDRQKETPYSDASGKLHKYLLNDWIKLILSLILLL